MAHLINRLIPITISKIFKGIYTAVVVVIVIFAMLETRPSVMICILKKNAVINAQGYSIIFNVILCKEKSKCSYAFINDSRKCKSAHERGESIREKQLGGRKMTANLFTKLKSEILL